MATIKVDGVSYKVTETLGYHQVGMPAKFVQTPDGERVAVKRGGVWTWWAVQDRVAPLLEHLQREQEAPVAELKACPFCGSSDIRHIHGNSRAPEGMAMCSSCGASDFVQRWNTRHAPELDEAVGAMAAVEWVVQDLKRCVRILSRLGRLT